MVFTLGVGLMAKMKVATLFSTQTCKAACRLQACIALAGRPMKQFWICSSVFCSFSV